MVTEIKNRCLSANYVAASLDCWTDRRMRPLFSVTAHTINNGIFESYVLGFSSMEESHTADALLSQFQDVVRTYDIEHKLVRLVTDSASNVTSAFKDLIVLGFAESFATMEEADDDDNEEQKAQLDDASIVSEKTSWDTGDSDVDEFLDIDFNRSFALRIPCFAHSIQLCVRDGLKVTSNTVCNALSKAAQIVKRSIKDPCTVPRYHALEQPVCECRSTARDQHQWFKSNTHIVWIRQHPYQRQWIQLSTSTSVSIGYAHIAWSHCCLLFQKRQRFWPNSWICSSYLPKPLRKRNRTILHRRRTSLVIARSIAWIIWETRRENQ